MLDIKEYISSDKLFDGHYRLLRTLSTDGGTADVWLALDVNTIEKDAPENDESSGMLVAIKIYRPKNALDIEGEQRFRDEYMIAHECRHTNLLPPEGFSIFKEMPYLVLPYCEAGSAEQFIGKPQNSNDVWKFISDVASGLDRLHSNQPQIIHQDIKPANILIDNNGNFTITDFGISSKTKGNHQEYYDEFNSGTLAYMAPERFDDNPHPMPQSDIWAFGATLCEILTGRVPFGEDGGLNQRLGKIPMPSLSGMEKNIRKLIHACLQKDPKKRPTARQIMEMAQNKKQKRPIAPILITLFIVAMAAALYFLPESPETEPFDPPREANFAQAEELLSNKMTAQEGFELLQSLVDQKDYQATFLMSRLYFDNSDARDTLFFNRKWETMRFFCELTPDNRQAHNLLMQAFELNDYDPVLLYQLGSDFLSGERRGCERNLPYASWCFEQAEKALRTDNSSQAKLYKDYLTKGRQRTNGITSKKPQRN